MRHSSSTSSSNDIRRFFGRVALLALALLALDQIGGRLADFLFFRATDGDTGEEINGLIASRAPVIVLGSSRAESHYVPEVLESKLRVPVFNGGYKGSNALFDYGVEQIAYHHYRPRMVIYDFSDVAVAGSDPHLRLEPLYPFHDDPTVWAMIAEQGPLQSLLFQSRLYPYNSKIHSLVLFNIVSHRPGTSRGYVPQESVMPAQPPRELHGTEERYNPRLVQALLDLCASAIDHGSQLVVVISPHYSSGTYVLPTAVRDLLERHGVPVLDFNGAAFPQFADHRLFRDESHLNDAGARVFSAALGELLEQKGSLGSDSVDGGR